MVWALLLLGGAYAVLRYAVLGPGLGHPAPVWILNKALAVAGVGCVLAALRSCGRGDGSLARSWWVHFGVLMNLHILLSLLLFAPAHYPELFRPGGSLALAGNVVVLGGATASLAFLNAKRRWEMQKKECSVLDPERPGLLPLAVHDAVAAFAWGQTVDVEDVPAAPGCAFRIVGHGA